MSKAQMVREISKDLGISESVVRRIIESMVSAIIREVASGGRVNIWGLGTFSSVTRAPRTGRNPRTGEKVPIPERKAVQFKPGRDFKELVS